MNGTPENPARNPHTLWHNEAMGMKLYVIPIDMKAWRAGLQTLPNTSHDLTRRHDIASSPKAALLPHIASVSQQQLGLGCITRPSGCDLSAVSRRWVSLVQAQSWYCNTAVRTYTVLETGRTVLRRRALFMFSVLSRFLGTIHCLDRRLVVIRAPRTCTIPCRSKSYYNANTVVHEEVYWVYRVYTYNSSIPGTRTWHMYTHKGSALVPAGIACSG